MLTCIYAYRKLDKGTVHCKAQQERVEQGKDFCGHQYLCPNTGRWENTQEAVKCPLSAKAE